MDRTARVALLLAAGVVLAAPRPAVATDPCYENTLSCECLGAASPVVSTAPGQSCAGTWKAGDPCDGACYDLRLGLLQVVANRSLSCTDEASTADSYTVVNPPPGPPLAFYAELHVTGTLSGSATAFAVVSHDPLDYAAQEYSSSGSPVDDRLVIPVQYDGPGPIFFLGLTLRAALGATPGMADLTATLEFTGLPEGVVVVSCQGYTMPVPTLPSSWARVKATYR
jgi:hypothetical protein